MNYTFRATHLAFRFGVRSTSAFEIAVSFLASVAPHHSSLITHHEKHELA